MINMFLYGTLVEEGDEITHILPGYMMFHVKGNGFDFPVIQPYPWDDSLPSIKGVIKQVAEEDLPRLDIYEGVSRGLYTRTKAICYAVGRGPREPVEVQVYVGGPALVHQPIASGIWSDRNEPSFQ